LTNNVQVEEEFHEMMEKALEVIPDNFKSKIENLAFISEPYPSENDLERLNLKVNIHCEFIPVYPIRTGAHGMEMLPLTE
jgi:predicted Zn-dependent protease with MMP-like domain